MAEYIDKDKLLNAIECIDISDCTDIDDIFTEVERTIDEQPNADVVEVRHGKWIENEDGILYCSECKEEVPHESVFEEQFDYDWEENLVPGGYEEHKEYIKTNYCPNCGARMDGDT